MPWIATFEGAGVTEITQPQAQDFHEADGWLMPITPLAGSVEAGAPRRARPFTADGVRSPRSGARGCPEATFRAERAGAHGPSGVKDAEVPA